MKKYFYLFVAAVASLAMVSCDKNKPEEPGTETATYKIAVSDITATAASVTVTPSDSNTYYFDIWTKEEFDAIGADSVSKFYPEYFDYLVEYYAYYGYDIAWEDLVSTGVDSYDFDELDPETEYYAIALPVDLNAKTCGEITFVSFKTAKLEKINFSIAITEDDTAFFFNPSDEDATYLMTYVDKDSLGSYTSATYWDAFVAKCQQYVEAYASYGVTLADFGYDTPLYLSKTQLEEGHSYYLLAQAVYGNAFYSDLFTGEFTNAPAATVAPAPAHITNASMFSAKKEINNIQKKEFGHKRPNFVIK